ncbi:DUF6193 family natural product biosynthesis protein [Catellatospora sp. KI3]|uniref:DUF6193 family natural product biosynthesis protein n=1 Tax=Catellatospora sp. KI3 TaxID=3041620 RepID=UPI0024824215|nr:DUF6193 family natural product biosynthesis protein [Catellatospora sp. KI3]MDI1463118.1 DUF6193 family natural product biosynthesis protein [Catellatospora sp. KI3]
MSTPPDRATLYPEVAAEGSLAAYLRTEALAQGLDLVAVPDASDPVGRATVASTIPGREPLTVQAWLRERQWSVNGESRGLGARIPLSMIEGRTRRLSDVPALAVAWRDGGTLAQVADAAPFAALTGHYEVPDDSPGHYVASQWGRLRREAQDVSRSTYRELIEAAYAQPVLRGLFAFNSMWTLRFTTEVPTGLGRSTPRADTGGFQVEKVMLNTTRQGTFTLRLGWEEPVLAEAGTAEQIVAYVVDRLPADLGPAVWA